MQLANQSKISIYPQSDSPGFLFAKLATSINRITKKRMKFSVKIGGQNVILTQREYECLLCLLEGKTAKETAKKLCISNRTVENYFINIRQKTWSCSKSTLLYKIWDNQHD